MRFLIPEGGVSGLDKPGGPFWDPAADRALFDVDRVRTSAPAPNRKLIRLPHHSTTPRSPTRWSASFREIEITEGQAAWPASRATTS